MRQATRITVSIALVCVAALLLPAAYADKKGETVTLKQEVGFSKASGVTSNVEAQCTLQTRLP